MLESKMNNWLDKSKDALNWIYVSTSHEVITYFALFSLFVWLD